MNQALARKQGPNAKPDLKVVQPKPRTFDDVMREGRGKNPFKQWNLMVEKKVDQAMGKPGVPKDRKEARDHVLAQDRSYWM
jgi:hypothetical protein